MNLQQLIVKTYMTHLLLGNNEPYSPEETQLYNAFVSLNEIIHGTKYDEKINNYIIKYNEEPCFLHYIDVKDSVTNFKIEFHKQYCVLYNAFKKLRSDFAFIAYDVECMQPTNIPCISEHIEAFEKKYNGLMRSENFCRMPSHTMMG